MYILLAIAILIQTGMGIVIYGLVKKSKEAIYIVRKGDKLFFVDGDGNILTEKIIIQKTI